MTALVGLPRVWGAVSRYGSAVRWLVQTLWEAFRWRLVRALVAAQIGVLVVGAGLSLSLGYLHQLEVGGEMRFRDVALSARDQTTLTVMVLVILVTLIAGGGIIFFAQQQIVGMASELNHHVRMRIALAYGGELPAADWRDERSVWRSLWLLQTRDARRTAIVARSLLRNTVNLTVIVVGTGALFYLEAGMTLLFLVIMALAMISYYRTNATSARATRRYEAIAPGTRRGLRRLLPSFQTLSQPAPDADELAAALGTDAVTEETASFRDRFGAHIHAEFLGFAIMGVALAGLTTFLGRQALAGAIPWTRLLAYLLVLRFTINGIQSALRTFAFFSRFYPSIDRLNRFLAASNGATTLARLETLPVRLAPGALSEDAEAVRPVRQGEVVEVVLPVPLSRYSLGLLAPVFVGDDPARRRHLLGQIALAVPLKVPPAAVSLHSLVMLNGATGPQQLRQRLGEHATTVEAAVGTDPFAAAPPEAWASLSRPAMDRLVLAAAELSERPVLALDRRLTTRDELERLGRTATDRIVVVCSSGSTEGADELGIRRQFVASAGGAVVAAGSPAWVARNWEAIGDQPQEGSATPATWSDDELDDED